MLKKSFKFLPLSMALFIGGSMVMTGCGESETKGGEVTDTEKDANDDPSTDMTLKLGGQFFSIPSPFETATMLKESGAPFNGNMINVPENASNYTTDFYKALNLGIYGADLGYITIYNNNSNDAISYLTAVQKLAEEVRVGGAFDKALIDRFSQNMGNQDSMLVLVSDAYRSGDQYLKNNDKSDVASLILAGGWIEALHFACEIAVQLNNPDVISRIGEQKTTLENLIMLLRDYSEEDYTLLADELQALYDEFGSINYSYEFKEPAHDKESMTTTIKSKRTVDVSAEALQAIADKVKEIRTKIVESSL
jgi:hypothetical protein